MEVAAERERVWDALLAWVGGQSTQLAATGAGLLGCRERQATGEAGREGSTIVGFRVERSRPPADLVLAGRHRFSRYSLSFVVDDLGAGRSRLRAVTRAAFPGAAGRAYRSLVIGSRLHVLAVRRILRRVRERAELPAA